MKNSLELEESRRSAKGLGQIRRVRVPHKRAMPDQAKGIQRTPSSPRVVPPLRVAELLTSLPGHLRSRARKPLI